MPSIDPHQWQLNAPAKVNWFLTLHGLRPDGYHELTTLMQTLSLCDTLTLTVQPGTGLQFTCSDPALQTDGNLVLKAAQAYLSALEAPHNDLSQHLQLHLDKHIPTQAGLGGGSSDAAATLRLLNAALGRPLPDHTLLSIAQGLGSDVAFFLTGGLALGTGRGEVITPIALTTSAQTWLENHSVWLMKPNHLGIASAQAYQAIRQAHCYAPKPCPIQGPTLPISHPWAWETWLHNDFQGWATDTYSALKALMALGQSLDLPPITLSGSGSACFMLIEPNLTVEPETLNTLVDWLDTHHWWHTIAQPLCTPPKPHALHPTTNPSPSMAP